MSDTRENHCNSVFVGCFDNFFITDRTAWLDYGSCAPPDRLKKTHGKWKESV
jgi:hypothetical protein